MSAARSPLTFVSFAGDESNLGILVLDGVLNAKHAAERATELGINPGGEVLAIPVPSCMPEALYRAHLENRNRLLQVAEAAPLFDLARVDEPATLPICEDHWLDQGEPT